MESVHENGLAGRARAAIPQDDVGQATPPSLRARRRRQPFELTPARTCDEIQWGNWFVRLTVINLLDAPDGPLAHVHPDARAMLKQFAIHRNPKTAEITPGVPLLAHELTYKDRRVRYVFGLLDEGPSVQRDGSIVEGLGLIQRESRWRPYGGQTSNLFVFTYKCWLALGVVEPHEPKDCACCRAELHRAERRGRPATPRPLVQPRMQPRRPEAPAAEVPSVVAAPVTASPSHQAEPHQAAAEDKDLAAFVAVFAAERAAKYGDRETGTLRVENRSRVAAYVVELTAEANAWAQSRDLAPDWLALREDLCRRMVRAWLAMPGTGGFLDERRHPIGLMVDDLQRVGPEALAEWKRAQPKPKIVAAAAEAPPPVLELDVDELGAEPERSAATAEPAEDPAEVQARCAELRAALFSRLSPLSPAAQHDATWSMSEASPAPPPQDDLAVVRAKAAEIEARGGGESPRARPMSVLLAEQAEASGDDDPASEAAAAELHRGRRTRSSLALFLPGVVAPVPEAKAEDEPEPEEIGEERPDSGEGRAWSRRESPSPRTRRRGRGS